MSREEAIIQLRLGPGINEDVSEEYNEAVEMAIKALQQQPCEDEKIIKVSKGTLKARTGKYVVYDVEWLKTHFNTTEAKIYGQPKEEPQQKTGHWISQSEYCKMNNLIPSGLGRYFWCSECNCGIDYKYFHLADYNYCPKCGAKMQETK